MFCAAADDTELSGGEWHSQRLPKKRNKSLQKAHADQFKRRECEWCGWCSRPTKGFFVSLRLWVHLGCKFIKAAMLVSAFCAICVSAPTAAAAREELILFLWSIMRAWFRWRRTRDPIISVRCLQSDSLMIIWTLCAEILSSRHCSHNYSTLTHTKMRNQPL